MTILDRLARILVQPADSKTMPAEAKTDALAAISSVWQNAWTGLGSSGTDRVTAHVPGYLSVLTDNELEVLHLGDGIANKVNAKIVNEAFKNGLEISYDGEDESSRDMVQIVEDQAESIGLADKGRMAAILGRAYGMGGLILGVNNGAVPTETALLPRMIQSLDYIVVIDKRDLSVAEWTPPRGNKRFSEHRYYIPAGDRTIHGLDAQRLHASHIVAFGGLRTSIRDRRRYWAGFDSPALQPVWDVIRRFDAAHQSIDAMLQDGSQGVMRIRDLWKVVTQAGGLTKLETRMQLSALYRAAHKWIVLDAGGADGSPAEDFNWVERSFAGLSEISQDKQALVAAVADMPITVLFGRSPAGENATGEHDALNWHASVKAWFADNAKQQLTQIVQIIALAAGAKDPGGFNVGIPPMKMQSALQIAELEERIAKIDEIRISQGFPAETILMHRHGMGMYDASPPMLTDDDISALGVSYDGEDDDIGV